MDRRAVAPVVAAPWSQSKEVNVEEILEMESVERVYHRGVVGAVAVRFVPTNTRN